MLCVSVAFHPDTNEGEASVSSLLAVGTGVTYFHGDEMTVPSKPLINSEAVISSLKSGSEIRSP